MQEDDAAVLLLLPEVREGGEVDEVAEVVARVFGYAQVGAVLLWGVSGLARITYIPSFSQHTNTCVCVCYKGWHET